MAFNLRRADRLIMQVYDEELRGVGLRPTQFSLLNALAASEPVTVSLLAERLLMDRTTLTRNLGPLERQKLVRSETTEDKRERILVLTPPGRKMLAQALPRWEAAQRRIRRTIGAHKVEQLVKDLAGLAGALEGE